MKNLDKKGESGWLSRRERTASGILQGEEEASLEE